jgi:5-keto-L-gluconate epimerase
MKFGLAVSTFPTSFGPILFSGNLAARLDEVAGLGYASIDLFIRRADEPGLEDVLAAIHRSGLSVAILAAVSAFADEGLFLSSPDPLVRTTLIERMKGQIRLAASLGASVPIGLLRGREGGAERLKLLANSLFELYRFSQPLGVDLVLEPVNRYETQLINTIGQAIDFLQSFGLPPLPLLPDVFHMNIEEVSIEAAFLEAGPRIGHVHFADSNRRVPGQGHIAWPRIFAALHQAGYDGACSLEAIPGPDPLEDARQGLAFLLQTLGAA